MELVAAASILALLTCTLRSCWATASEGSTAFTTKTAARQTFRWDPEFVSGSARRRSQGKVWTQV